MKTALIVVSVLTLALVSPGFSAEGGAAGDAPGKNFEQKKADRIKQLDARIAHIQAEKSCLQAATDLDAFKACREKFKPEDGSKPSAKK